MTLRQFTPAGFADSVVGAVAEKTSFVLNEDPVTGSSLTVWTTDGRVLLVPVAPAASPVTEDQLIAKFTDCASYLPKPPGIDSVGRIVDGILNLDKTDDVRTVLTAL